MPPAVPGVLSLRTAAQRAGKRLKGVDLRFGLPTGAPEGRAGGAEGTTLALRALWATAVVLLLATAVQAVVTHRTLYQDGGHYLVVLLQTERATDWFWARHFAQVLTQWPLVMALRAGLEDLPACMTIQAVGLFYLTPLVTLLALSLAAGDRVMQLLVLLFVGAYYLNADFGIISESHVLAALALLASVLLMRRANRASGRDSRSPHCPSSSCAATSRWFSPVSSSPCSATSGCAMALSKGRRPRPSWASPRSSSSEGQELPLTRSCTR